MSNACLMRAAGEAPDILCQLLKAVTSLTPQGDRAPESGSISRIRRRCSEVSVDWIRPNWTIYWKLTGISFCEAAGVSQIGLCQWPKLLCVATSVPRSSDKAALRGGLGIVLVFCWLDCGQWGTQLKCETVPMWTAGESLTHCFWNEDRGSGSHTARIDD